MKHIVLLSKDATLPEYFGPYSSKYTKTPNIDELASKGTVFRNHYTAAPSTAMAFTAMFTGKPPYQMESKKYVEVDEYKGVSLFDDLFHKGYECHLLWSSNYINKAEKYSKCYGINTIHHDKLKFNQSCGFNAEYQKENRVRDESLTEDTFQKILSEVDTIDYHNKNIFLWIHMPHCIYGRISYGDDIDVFDRLVGEIRSRFGDDNIFITADHGHMNGQKGKVGYGFDVYKSAVHIPLITPRINDSKEIIYCTSNIQLRDIILTRSVKPLPYLFCDSAYYSQPNRKLLIIKENFHYIFNKKSGKEELYDVDLDSSQSINLIEPFLWMDKDRLCKTDIRQVILYPYWDSIDSVVNDFRNIRINIWKNGTTMEEYKQKIHLNKIKLIYFIKGVIKKFKK